MNRRTLLKLGAGLLAFAALPKRGWAWIAKSAPCTESPRPRLNWDAACYGIDSEVTEAMEEPYFDSDGGGEVECGHVIERRFMECERILDAAHRNAIQKRMFDGVRWETPK